MSELKLDRSMPVRVTLSILAVGCFAMTMLCIGKWGLPATETYDALFGLLTVLGVAVGGDTIRPSGQKVFANQAHKIMSPVLTSAPPVKAPDADQAG